MIIPKRFKIHLAATTELRLSSSGFIGRGHACVVRVPVLEPDERPGEDLPRMERGEARAAVAVDPKALAVATQGSKGEGQIRLVRTIYSLETIPTGAPGQQIEGRVEATESCAGDGKPWVRHARPDTDQDEHDDAVQRVFREAILPPARGRIAVEVCLNVDVLAAVAAAVGASDGEVRVKFHIIEDTGRCDTERAIIEVRPMGEAPGVLGVVMAVAAP